MRETEGLRESKGGRVMERGTAVEKGNSVGERKTPKRVRPGPGCDRNRMELPRVLHHTQKPMLGAHHFGIPMPGV